MDKHLLNVMRRPGTDPIGQCFLNTTSAVHWTFSCKDQDGNLIAQQGSDGKLYGIRACFLYLDPEQFDTNEKIRDIVNNNFGPALWNSIDKTEYKLAKASDRPHLEPVFDDVIHHVQNWSDAFMNQSDIYSVARQILKREKCKMNDWLRDDHNNLYTLVKSGSLDPATAQKFYLPFSVFSNVDKTAYQAFMDAANLAAQQAADAATPKK